MDNKKTPHPENKTPRDIFDYQRKTLQLMGQWPIDSAKTPVLLKILIRFYEIFMVLLPLQLAISHAKSVYDNWNNGLDKMADFVPNMIICWFCSFATAFFIIRSNKIMNLVTFMNQNFRHRSARGLTYVTLEQSYKKARFYSYAWIASCVSGTVAWSIYPLLTNQRVLPLRCWYPFDENQPIVYEILYALQFFAQLQVGVVFANGSGVYVGLITLICGQYDILFCSFKNLLHTADYLDGGKMDELRNLQQNLNMKNEEINQYYCSSEILENIPFGKVSLDIGASSDPNSSLKEAIKDCVKHHHVILKVCQALEEVYNPYCLVKSLQVTFQLCFLLFMSVNQSAASILRNVILVQYLTLTGFELVLFTYFGEVLRIQSLRVGESLMRCAWYKRSVAIRKDIMIILPNSLRAITLTSGKFYPMDVQRLKSVVTSAFSFFTLLQNMKDKRD